MYAVFSSAMGGAKLKTKYQTPLENRRTKSNSRSNSNSSGKKKKSDKTRPKTAKKTSSRLLLNGAQETRKMSQSHKNVEGSDVMFAHLSLKSGRSSKLLENAQSW